MIFNIPELYKQRRALKKMRRSLRAIARNRSFPAFFALALIVSGTFGGYFSLHAATSTRRAPIVFQGRISDANYVPVADGSRNMIFRIWDASTGGNCIWITGAGTTNCSAITNSGSTDVPVTITRGVFSAALGDTSVSNMPALDQDFDNQSSQTYYLSISVETDSSGTYEDLSPRIRMSAVPYAYNSDELDGLNSTSFLRSDAFNGSPTTITAINDADGITASDTTITVDSTSNYPALGGTLFIESEIVTYTGTTSTTFTGVSRGQHGTTAATHADNVLVSNYLMIGARNATLPGGTVLDQRAFDIQAPTYSGSAAQTITTGATVSIDGPPVEGNDNLDFTSRANLWLRGTNHTWGAFLHINYPSVVTMASSSDDPNWVLGTNVNLSSLSLTGSTTDGTGITNVTGQLVDGSLITLPAVTVSTASGQAHLYGLRITGGALNTTGSGLVNEWFGARIQMPNITQAAGTTTSTGIYVNGGTVTSGTSYAFLSDGSAGNVGFGTTTPTSFLTITQPVLTTGSPTAMTVTGGAHTTLTAAETTDVNFNLNRSVQFTRGASITNQRAVRVQPPTYTATSGGTQTIVSAATMAIEGMPIAGSNTSIQSNAGLWLEGNSPSDGNFLLLSYPSATSITGGTLFGVSIDLSSNLTANNESLYGSLINLPGATNSTNQSMNGIQINGTGTVTTTANTTTWTGISITTPTISQSGTGATFARGISISGSSTSPVGGAAQYSLVINDAAGNVLIGTTAYSPTSAYKVEVVNSATTDNGVGLRVTHTGAATTGYAFQALKTGAGTTNIGGYFSASGATSNYGLLVAAGNVGIGTLSPDTTLDLSGTLSYTPSTTQIIDEVSDKISANAAYVVLNPASNLTMGGGGAVIDDPTGAPAGQIIYITLPEGEANTLTLDDESASGFLTNVELGAASRTLGALDVLVLIFNGTHWIEVSYSNN